MNGNENKIRLISHLATILFLSLMVGLVISLLALFYPYKTIEFYNNPLPVLNSPVKRGEPIHIYVEYTRYTNLPCTAVARFTNSITFSSPAQIFHKQPGSFKGISTSFSVPHGIPPGKYFMEICFSYEPNPMRTIVKYVRTKEFEVK
jgi:hypothetical protein